MGLEDSIIEYWIQKGILIEHIRKIVVPPAKMRRLKDNFFLIDMIHITFYWDAYFPFRAFAVKLWGDVYKATWPSKRKRLQFSGQVKAVYPICGCILFWGLFPGMLHEHLKVLDDHNYKNCKCMVYDF